MPTTRLAAIMFTDIVGYTAMMQKNRESAMATVKEFEGVLKNQITSHDGKLLQTYGDGSLSIFESASAAVNCAKSIQEKIRVKIPLRIGIHLGEITIDGKHTFGDGVNIASRVESMGIAGAVLVSDSIRQQVKNNPEFQLESLGKFAFKNVAEPMTVYGLANEGFVLPKPEQMKGKGKRASLSARSLVKLASLGFGAMLLGAVLVWQLGLGISSEGRLLSKDIREAKVAVNVFENFTGDDDLEALGYMASEWISSGLRELQIRTVSNETVRKNKESIGILPDNPKNIPSFAEITGAEYLVTGSYFLKGDSIVLNTSLSSAIDGEEITTFDDLRGHKDHKEKLIQEALDYMMGYWAARKDGYERKITPPKYEAYKVFMDCLPLDTDCILKALALDPSFLSARVGLLNAAAYEGKDSIYNSNIAFVKENLSKTTVRDRFSYDWTSNARANNYKVAVQAMKGMYELDRDDPDVIHYYASATLYALNKPQLAVEIY
ncbi:MAG: adenylate/guanylate cyclase domain-containing protein [Bacteroidota bacterium]